MTHWMTISISIALAAGLLSFALSKWKKVQWSLFLLNAAWQLFAVFQLWSLKGTVEKIKLPFTFLGIENIELTLVNSEIGYFFLMASVLITLIFAVFSFSYNDKKHATGIAPLWTLLMGANFALFLSADWITFIAAWELMGWTSYFIISHGKLKSAKAGLYYFILSLIGTSTLLAAVMLIIQKTGTLMLKEGIGILSSLWTADGSFVLTVAVLLTLTFFAKSAVFPFYMWPAKAHAEAPDDFSAFLSGVMIKYGVFGLMSMVLPLFGASYHGAAILGIPVFLFILGWIGAFTALWGTLLAIRENDMKRLMAYSTVSNIGFILAALSMNTYFGLAAALFHTVNHMVFKGGIFLSMASVKFRTGEREMHRLGGMGYRMPIAFFGFLISIIAAAGIPPTSGFASKWLVFQSLFNRHMFFMAIPIFLASTGAFLYLYRGLHSIYLGQLSPRFKDIKDAPPLQSLAMIILMLVMLAAGFFPGIIMGPVNEVLSAVSNQAVKADWTSISGFTSSVDLLIAGSVFLGAFVFAFILFLIGKKRRFVEMMDNYTAGETPEDWGLTPEDLHYAMKFYEPFEKMTAPALDKINAESWFSQITLEVSRFANAVKNWFASPHMGTLVMTLSVIIILVIGILL